MEPARDVKGLPSRIAKLVERNCTTCHTTDGSPHIAPSFAPPFFEPDSDGYVHLPEGPGLGVELGDTWERVV